MAGWNFTLYGSDTDESTEFPLITVVAGHSDIKSITFKARGAFPSAEPEREPVVFLSKNMESAGDWRIKFNVKSTLQFFPAATTALDTNIATDVLNKLYHWLDLSDYNKKPSGYLTSGVVAVAVVAAEVEYDAEKGGHRLNFELARREV